MEKAGKGQYWNLFRFNPDLAKELFQLNEETVRKRYDKLTRMQNMYG